MCAASGVPGLVGRRVVWVAHRSHPERDRCDMDFQRLVKHIACRHRSSMIDAKALQEEELVALARA